LVIGCFILAASIFAGLTAVFYEDGELKWVSVIIAIVGFTFLLGAWKIAPFTIHLQ
jgi:hypothetical protein